MGADGENAVSPALAELAQPDEFVRRHCGHSDQDIAAMLATVGANSLAALIDETLPPDIRLPAPLKLPAAKPEYAALERLAGIAANNTLCRNFIGQGYYGTRLPAVIQRNVLENPGWYTAYTPYQAEISQGRLAALLNFQHLVSDLTGLPTANASLLDEATAAAEAMSMARRVSTVSAKAFFVDSAVFPQTLDVVKTRAHCQGFELIIAPADQALNHAGKIFGALLQTPNQYGECFDYSQIIAALKAQGVVTAVACDLLSLLLLKSPGAMGADIALGSAQRFGVPMGFGGPHAAFFACRDEYRRALPGRIIGVARDARGRPALRMALQTREQHIRREKANSNICTSQVLLANLAGFYAVWHGPHGLRRIARRVHRLANMLSFGLARAGVNVLTQRAFDTLVIETEIDPPGCNLRQVSATTRGVSFDETHGLEDVALLLTALTGKPYSPSELAALDVAAAASSPLPGVLREDAVLSHPIFNRYHTEHALLRYLKRLQNRDLALDHAMIPLGSCTMKLNPAAAMLPITWPAFASPHPYAPARQMAGYAELCADLTEKLKAITGFAAISLQPNAGSQGEYAGLLAIRRYFASRGQAARDICLIPRSAHGTNPATAHLCGLTVVVVACDAAGNVDVADLAARLDEYRARIACLMITYPSTHGVFEARIQEICARVHEAGGQVYMDGANLNAQVGLTSPAFIGADVAHLNLHKTFAIPHGGGGPGMGPIGLAAHLAPFAPGHVFQAAKGEGEGAFQPARSADTPPEAKNQQSATNSPPLEGRRAQPDAVGGGAWAVSAAPYGSASILPISWMYIEMLGGAGLTQATRLAILNANYVASKLDAHYPVLYRGAGGKSGRVAHECILDARAFKTTSGVTELDIAKRLMDYGFHAPTVSFPVAGTLMVEPTESEDKAELDRFCAALIAIRAEIRQIETGAWPRDNNPLKNAPHTQADLMDEHWRRPYSRQVACFPLPWVAANKFWPTVNRIDDVWGDRNLVCVCPPLEEADLSLG